MKIRFAIFFTMTCMMISFCVSQNVNGSLEGWIVGSTDLPIPGVSVILSSPSLQGTRGVSSDEKGFYRILALPSGTYTVRMNHIAFRTLEMDGIKVHIGRTTSIRKAMMVTQQFKLSEVTILEERPLIDHTSTTSGSNLGIELIRDLPIDRSYQSVPSLLPHANVSYHGDGINYSGATGVENKYFVNGVEVTSSFDGFSSTNLPYNFIRELQIKTGGYEAEYKSSLGGILNIVTPSGGNEISGQAFGFLTSSSLSGSERSTRRQDPVGSYTQYDMGMSIGGPISQDQLWYFLAFNPKVDYEMVPIGGQKDQEDRSTINMFAGNLQWRLNERHSLGITIIGDPQSRRGVGAPTAFALGVWDSVANLDAWLSDIHFGGVSAIVQGTHMMADNLLLESFISYGRKINRFLPVSERGYNFAYFDNMTSSASGGLLERRDYTLDDGCISVKSTWFLGSHTLKAGVEVQQSILDNNYTVKRLQRLSDSLYYLSDWHWDGIVKSRIPSLFVQDAWRPFASLTLNAGLRWEAQYIYGPSGALTQKIINMFQPRLGIIIEPWEDGRDKFYASFGRYYQPLSLYLSSAYNVPKPTLKEALYYTDPRVDSSSLIIGVSGFYYLNSPDLHGQYYDEFTLGYERLFFSDLKFNIRGIHRFLGEAINDFLDPGTGLFLYGNPCRYPMEMWPRAKRNYTAIELTAERSSSTGLNITASYVLSRNYGNYGGLINADVGFSPMPNTNSRMSLTSLIPRSEGLLPNDRTHVLKLVTSQRLITGLNAGVFFLWMSGTPLSEYGTDASGLPIFLTERSGAGRTPSLWDLSARVTYDLSFLIPSLPSSRIIVDLFHIASQRTAVLFDQEHYFGVPDEEGNQSDPNPYYGKPITFQPPMSVRLGMEVNF